MPEVYLLSGASEFFNDLRVMTIPIDGIFVLNVTTVPVFWGRLFSTFQMTSKWKFFGDEVWFSLHHISLRKDMTL